MRCAAHKGSVLRVKPWLAGYSACMQNARMQRRRGFPAPRVAMMGQPDVARVKKLVIVLELDARDIASGA